jgi:hypothetical protein
VWEVLVLEALVKVEMVLVALVKVKMVLVAMGDLEVKAQ